jgi:hypothetical protein
MAFKDPEKRRKINREYARRCLARTIFNYRDEILAKQRAKRAAKRADGGLNGPV